MWLLTALVFLYVCLGGMRAAAYVGVLQGLLFAASIAAVGIVAWAGSAAWRGWSTCSRSSAPPSRRSGAPAATTPFATPGVVQVRRRPAAGGAGRRRLDGRDGAELRAQR